MGAALLIYFPMVARAELPNGECTAPGFTCELDYVTGIVNNVASEEECRQMCEENSIDCTIYSFYGEAGVPFQDTCILYREVNNGLQVVARDFFPLLRNYSAQPCLVPA